VADAERVEGTTVEEGQQRDQATSSEIFSPSTSATKSQDRVGVRGSLQIARKGWNICEVVKDTEWWSRTVIKDHLGDSLVFSIADVMGKDCSLGVLDIDREACDSGADLIETEGGVRDLSTLE